MEGEMPAWKSSEEKFYITLPTLYILSNLPCNLLTSPRHTRPQLELTSSLRMTAFHKPSPRATSRLPSLPCATQR